MKTSSESVGAVRCAWRAWTAGLDRTGSASRRTAVVAQIDRDADRYPEHVFPQSTEPDTRESRAGRDRPSMHVA